MIKPIKDFILVKVDKELEKTDSGIYIPENAKEKQQKGSVIAAGKDVYEVAVGDKVLFGKYSGSEVELDGQSYLIFKEEDVLAVLS